MQKVSVIISLLLVCVCITVAGAESTTQPLSHNLEKEILNLEKRIELLEDHHKAYNANLRTHLATVQAAVGYMEDDHSDQKENVNFLLAVLGLVVSSITIVGVGSTFVVYKNAEKSIQNVKDKSQSAIEEFAQQVEVDMQNLKHLARNEKRVLSERIDQLETDKNLSKYINHKISQDEILDDKDREKIKSLSGAEEMPHYIRMGVEAAIAFDQKDYDKAGDLYSQAAEAYNDATYFCNAARAYVMAATKLAKTSPVQAQPKFQNAISLYEKASESSSQLPARSYANWSLAHSNYALTLCDPKKAMEHLNEAVSLSDKAISLTPEDYRIFKIRSKISIRKYYFTKDQKEKEQYLSKAKKAAMKANSRKENSGSYLLACIEGLSNHTEKCRNWLERAINDDMVRPTFGKLMSDPDLDNVRELSWFKDILEQVRQREENKT